MLLTLPGDIVAMPRSPLSQQCVIHTDSAQHSELANVAQQFGWPV